MPTILYVYLFPDTANYIAKKDNKILENVERDTKTKIEFYPDYSKKRNECYFIIEGEFENAHKARIILQEIEKDIYRECFMNHHTQ